MEQKQNSDTNLISLISEFIREMAVLISEHIKLLKLEFAENAHKFIKAAVALVLALIFAYLGLVFLGLLIVYLLSMAVDMWVALLLVTAVYFGVPLILLVYAINMFHKIFKEPKKSLTEVEKTGEEAKKWMKNIKK